MPWWARHHGCNCFDGHRDKGQSGESPGCDSRPWGPGDRAGPRYEVLLVLVERPRLFLGPYEVLLMDPLGDFPDPTEFLRVDPPCVSLELPRGLRGRMLIWLVFEVVAVLSNSNSDFLLSDASERNCCSKFASALIELSLSISDTGRVGRPVFFLATTSKFCCNSGNNKNELDTSSVFQDNMITG